MSEINLGTVYDINKQAMKNEKPLDPILLNKKLDKVSEWMFNGANYYMLLSNENKDYTVFDTSCSRDKMSIVCNLRDCLSNRGQIIAIDKQNDGNYEIWLRIDGEDFVYYIFDYSWGIIYCD